MHPRQWDKLKPTFPGPRKAEGQVVIVRDSQYVGRGNFTGTGLDLIRELGLVSQTTSIAIRLWKMGFISRNYLKHSQKDIVSILGTYSYIRQSG